MNVLYSIYPNLAVDTDKTPHGSVDLGGNYQLLRAMDNCARVVQSCASSLSSEPGHYVCACEHLSTSTFKCKLGCFKRYLINTLELLPSDVDLWDGKLIRWARLQLPTGQIAHSAWKDSAKVKDSFRVSNIVKV